MFPSVALFAGLCYHGTSGTLSSVETYERTETNKSYVCEQRPERVLCFDDSIIISVALSAIFDATSRGTKESKSTYVA